MTNQPDKPHNMKPHDARCLNMFCHLYRQIVVVTKPGEVCPECKKYLITVVKSNIDELAKRDSEPT